MEKKEIGKLLEYINKYGKSSNCGPFETCRIEPATNYNSSYLVLSWDDNGEGDWKSWHLEVPRLISKEYGFIQRLVKNDKIDFEHMKGHGKIISYLTDEKDYKWNDIKEGVVLMLLSISDTPIEDLISYLR